LGGQVGTPISVPELPDVEGFRRVLADHAVGRRIRRVDVLDAGVLHDVTTNRLQKALRGREFGRPWRHGKRLIIPVTGPRSERDGAAPAVLLHFGMTGSLRWADDQRSRHRHDRIVFVFSGGELCYRDMRKLHGLRLMRDQDDIQRVLAELGPDAADLSLAQLRDLLTGRRRQVKPALVDQSILAGLGNLLADEILWRARIHPRQPCAQLQPADFARLHARMRTVLRQSIEQGRVPPRKTWLTGRRDETSGSCPRCGSTLSHGRVGGRGTTWCPRCQRL
jgi:formamidopyrimidine-DNA glycosylase